MARKQAPKHSSMPMLNSSSPGKALLLTTVTISGGAVMILELLGTRVIAPYYGTSLHVWSALIAVTMIALAIGYYAGGYLADRYPRLRLTHILILASLTTSLIPSMSGIVLNATNPLGMRAGSFCSAFLLFGLPLTALAMVGPFVIKLATETLDDVGSTVGSVYAISFNGFTGTKKDHLSMTVLHQAESVYGWVRVVDTGPSGARLLLSDASVLSAMALTDGKTLLHYQNIIGSLPVLRSNPSDALLLGLGGGHIATALKARGMVTDTIEIDPIVAEASLNYFRFKPTGQFIVGDARYEVKNLNKTYDFIIHDCFTGGSEPTHLLTVEMLRDLRRLLKKDGILALNYVGFTRGEGTRAVASVYKTLKSVLPNVKVVITEKTEMTDFIMLASDAAIELKADSRDSNMQWLANHEYPLDDNQGVIITDDYNPIESMQIRKTEAYRDLFIKRVAPDLLLI